MYIYNMKAIFDKLNGLKDLKSFEIRSLEKFIKLEPMNKSNFTDVMRHVNDLVNRLSTTQTLIQNAIPKGESYYCFLKTNSVIHKDGFTFLQKIDFEGGERPLKQFKYDNLSDFEKLVYNSRKEFLEIKAKVKEHADKLKALIITREVAKETKAKITPFQKVFPNALDKYSIEDVLIEQTKILKDEYLEQTTIYAAISFENIKKTATLTYKEFCEKYPVQTLGVVKYRKALRNYDNAKSIYALGYDKYLSNKLYMATLHYYESIQKLAYRLNRKGIIESKDFTIKTAKVSQNIETTIVDKNGKITRAWTIVASGEIQQPHFRYLVK